MDYLTSWFSSAPTYNHNNCKAYVKLALIRTRARKTKLENMLGLRNTVRSDSNSSDPTRKTIAKDLEERKESTALAKAEQFIRDLHMIEALTYVELHLQEVEGRLDILRGCGKPPPDIAPAVDTLMYVAPRIGIQELQQLVYEWTIKFGPQYKQYAVTNKFGTINPQIKAKLQTIPPKVEVHKLLQSVAKSNGISWTSDSIDGGVEDSPAEIAEEEEAMPPYDDSDDDELMKELEKCKPGNFQTRPESNDIAIPSFAGFGDDTQLSDGSLSGSAEFPVLSLDNPNGYWPQIPQHEFPPNFFQQRPSSQLSHSQYQSYSPQKFNQAQQFQPHPTHPSHQPYQPHQPYLSPSHPQPQRHAPQQQPQPTQNHNTSDPLQQRLARHLQPAPQVSSDIEDLDLPDVPHTPTDFRPTLKNNGGTAEIDDNFDLPDITPGYAQFTSSIRVVPTSKGVNTGPVTGHSHHSDLPELDELSSRLNMLRNQKK